MEPIIQIAGIKDRQEAEMLMTLGVNWLGFPLRLPVHREDLTAEEAATIIREIPPSVTAVLITYLVKAREITELCRFLSVCTVQLHADISGKELTHLRSVHPGLFLIKSLVVRKDNLTELLRQVELFSQQVDAFLTDSYDADSGATGATGKTHDWEVSRQIVIHSPRPVILAGGLTPANVGRAIRQVRPAGVDAHTGVESHTGGKDRQKVKKFVEEVRGAFGNIRTT